MTDSLTAHRDASVGTARGARLLVPAAVLWLVGDAIEIGFARTDTIADGWSFVVSEGFFYAAMILFVIALLRMRTQGVAGSSRAGRAGLVVAAIGWIGIMAGGLLLDFPGMETAGILMLLFGTTINIGEIMAGIGIARGHAVARPGAFVFLVYALASTVSKAVLLLASSDASPGHVSEIAMAGLWVLIGLSVLRPAQGRIWLGLALAAAMAYVAGAFIPF